MDRDQLMCENATELRKLISRCVKCFESRGYIVDAGVKIENLTAAEERQYEADTQAARSLCATILSLLSETETGQDIKFKMDGRTVFSGITLEFGSLSELDLKLTLMGF